MWTETLQELERSFPKAITLFPAAKDNDIANTDNMLKKIIKNIDADWYNFLLFTNGASILDYCLMGIDAVKIANISEVNHEIWQLNSWAKENFISFLGDSTGMNVGFAHQGDVTRCIAYLAEVNATAVLPIASSFSIFISLFLEDVKKTLEKWPSNSDETFPYEIATQELWPWDLGQFCDRDPVLKNMLKQGGLNYLYESEPDYITAIDKGIR